MPDSDSIQNRTRDFQRNPNLENVLDKLNRLLSTPETDAIAEFREPGLPQVFILGNARSGTTLALQWLAASGSFSYPTNLLSRFFRAPFIGALVQKVLTDPALAFRDELGDFQRPIDFTSTMGKTRGALAPHEFWYFWRRFFPGNELRPIDETNIAPAAIAELQREFAALESLDPRPIAMKAMHMNFNVAFFAHIFPRSIFVHIRRNPVFNIQSLLEARTRQFGSVNEWYSVKPPEFDQLQSLDPIAQVAGQVFHTNRHVANALSTLPESRAFTLDYEFLCGDPAFAFRELSERIRAQSALPDLVYNGPRQFQDGNQLRLSPPELERIHDAWQALTGTELLP